MRPPWLTASFCVAVVAGCSLIDLTALDGEGGPTSGAGAGSSSAGPVSATSGVTAASPASGAGSASASSVASSTSSGEVYAEVVLADRPVAYFRLNDAGPGAFDEVSRTTRGTAVGEVGFGFAGAFEPESGPGIVMYQPGAIEITDVSGLEWSGAAPYTVEAWVNVAEEDLVPGTVARILTREIDGAPPPSGWFLGVSIAGVDADVMELTWERRPLFDPAATVTHAGASTEGFRHLVGRHADGQISLFVDGDLVGTVPASGDLAASGPIRLGAGPSLVAPYAGQIDEVAFYDYSLSDLQILHHFAAATD